MSNCFFVDTKCAVAYIEYIHDGVKKSSCAFEFDYKNKILLKVPRELGATLASFEIISGIDFRKVDEYIEEINSFENTFDVFSFTVDLPVGLYFIKPSICVFDKKVYGRRRGNEVFFEGEGDLLQITVSGFKYEEPKSIQDGIIYHIFVDRFCRGGNCKVPEYNVLVDGEWDSIPEYPEYPGAPLKNNTLYGGTLYGVISRMDYIASLGASAIYLSPIFTSVSNHKYDTADYMSVDEVFGGDGALRMLISEAEKRNIKIILDGVFNHTGSDSVYFNKNLRYDSLGAYQSKDSPYYEWYDFKSYPERYTCWWDIDILPRINPDIPSLRDFLTGDDGVVSKYRNMGVYGLRLDVADELSDDFIKSCKHCLSKSGESVLYGEVWEDASNKIAYEKRKTYYYGDELDGVMNYPLREALIGYLKNKNTSFLRYVLDEVFVNAPERILNTQMNFLGTHDTPRILTVLADKDVSGKNNEELSILRLSDTERKISLKKLKALYTVIATLPGIPAVFYGDEVGLEGYSDPFNRMPYPYGKEDLSLLSHYKKVGDVRRGNCVYHCGGFNTLFLDENIFVFERFDKHYSYITALNISESNFVIHSETKVCNLLSNRRDNDFVLESFTAEIFKTKRNFTFDLKRN